MCTNLIPIPSKCDSKVLWGKALVKRFARLFALSIFVTTTSPRAMISLIMWYFLSMWFPFLWFLGSLDYATTPLLSQNKVMGTCSILTTWRLERNFVSHIASFAASLAATYYASMVESAIQDCLILLQLMDPPPKVKTHLEVDFLKSRSDWNLSLYSQWESNPHYGKHAYNLSFSIDTWEYALQLANVLVLDLIDIGWPCQLNNKYLV